MKILRTLTYTRLIESNRVLAARIRELETQHQLLLLRIGLKGFSVCDVPATPATIMLRKVPDAG